MSMLLPQLDAHDWWIMLTGMVCAAACAIPGCYLVLKRMSMLGDAISHAILPGLAIAFLVSGTRDVLPMLLGAMAVGMLTAMLTSGLSRMGRVPEDASMGVVFTSLFALGVIMISYYARDIDLDVNCVFAGDLLNITADMRRVTGVEMPRTFVVLAGVLVANVVLTAVFWKELKVTAFDPALATTLGISAGAMHYGLMAVVAGTTVASFEAVGSILVVAMLVGPGATAHLLTDRLGRMVALAAVIAAASAAAGYLMAVKLNTSAAAPMAVCVGIAFVLAALFSPRHGVAARSVSRLVLSLRIANEDVLGMLYRAEEASRPELERGEIRAGLRRPIIARMALWSLRSRGLVGERENAYSLTPAGKDAAGRVIRSHRLWETYLTKELGLALDHVHDPSCRVEHFITRDVERGLSDELRAERDPHGREVPESR